MSLDKEHWLLVPEESRPYWFKQAVKALREEGRPPPKVADGDVLAVERYIQDLQCMAQMLAYLYGNQDYRRAFED